MTETTLAGLAERLQSLYARIERERMADVPILNPAIGIHAIGFQRWQQGYLGVMVTPWFMNLMLLPGEGENWDELPVLSQSTHVFPSGRYEFTVGHEADLGKYQMCSLFSPMFEFADDAAAVETAGAVIAALMVEENRDAGDISMSEMGEIWRGERPHPGDDELSADEINIDQTESGESEAVGGLGERLEKSMSRRQLLRASLLQEDSER